MKKLTIPAGKEQLLELKAGDAVLLSGIIYTARDAAHKKLTEMISAGEPLPFDLNGAVIYYAGPCPAKPGQIFNSCGPTTSGRMDKYAPIIYENGASGAIGKGQIADSVKETMKKYGAVYFVATGGAGALIAGCVTSAQEVAFPELGAEAIRQLEIKDLPVIVGVDAYGNDLYETGYIEYKQK